MPLVDSWPMLAATALVTVRHALAAYPERTLTVTYGLTRAAGGWIISAASLQP